jgi:DNA repair exonuclease SbcCD ATPase subunit
MNLTKEYFDKALKNLAGKDDLQKQTAALMEYSDNQVEALARMVQAGFEDMRQRLDVRAEVEKLKEEMKEVKEALHV